jgi:hypothetical protein
MSNQVVGQNSIAVAAKPYVKPNLIKGPVLTSVTAQLPPKVSNVAPCWVARAAFGVADIRWMIFRAWLMDDAPAWFRGLYIRYGEYVGTWLIGRPRARSLVRVAMTPAINRKIRG